MPATPRSSHALLIVESLRWHVRLQNDLERPDVDAYLHRGGDREEIDLGSPPVQLVDIDLRCEVSLVGIVVSEQLLEPRNEDALELPLSIRRFLGLARELFAVKTERRRESLLTVQVDRPLDPTSEE